MKRFAKILTLLLAIVAIVTAFTVVALAEEETAFTVETPLSHDFEGYADGDTISNNTSKYGKMTAVEQDDGNVYMLISYEAAEANNENHDFQPSAKKYIIKDYPLMSFDFDIMSPTGDFSYGYINLRLYNYDTEKEKGVSVGYFDTGGYIRFSELGLDSTPYEWHHVTVVAEQDQTTSDFIFHTFVNGEKISEEADKTHTATITAEGYDTTYLGINYFKYSAGPYYSEAGPSALDNVKMSYFTAGATVEDAAGYYYNENYVFPYKYTVATITDADGAVTYYDDLDKAIEAVKVNETLTLKEDVEGITIINKAAVIDTKIYDETGATGECYLFTPKSTEGYLITEENGVYTITKSEENVTVVFDPVCTDAVCTCYGEGVGHKQTYSVIVPVGQIPEFLPEIAIINDEGLVADFKGWSYTKGGEAEELTAVTAEQAAEGTLNIYPVYDVVKYDFSYVDANGECTFYAADEFETVLATAIANAGSKVVLYSDIEYYKSFALPKNSDITIDLNGHTLTRVNLYGSVYNYDATSQAYVAGTATKTQKNAFTMSKVGNVRFTMTSSKEGAEFRTVSVNGTAYYDADGKLEKYDITSLSGGSGILSYNQITTGGAEFNFENLDIYSLNFIYGSHNGSASHQLNITNCNFYRTTAGSETNGGYGYDCIFLSGTAKVAIKDSLLYFPASSVLKNYTRFIRIEGSATASITIDNCDVITDNTGVESLIQSINHSMTYTNCRIYQVGNGSSNYVPIFEDGTVTSNIEGAVQAGQIMVSNSQNITYSLPTSSRVTLDSETNKPVFDFGFADRDISFTRVATDITEESVTVTGANLSFLYHSNFEMVLYLPVREDMTYTSVVGFTKQSDTVLIDGEEYYAFTRDCTTAQVSEVFKATVTYTVNGVTYLQSIDVSALIYAEIILKSPVNSTEANAVANMVRFAKEARSLAGLTNASITNKFAELEALYALEDYKASTEYDDLGVDYSGLEGVGMSFAVKGNNASYVINLPVATFANAANATVTATFEDGTVATLGKTTTKTSGTVTNYIWYTTNTMHISEMLAQYITISITIPAADETSTDTVLSGTYSIGAYIQEMDNSFAKAMYEFGVAAKAYREYLETL